MALWVCLAGIFQLLPHSTFFFIIIIFNSELPNMPYLSVMFGFAFLPSSLLLHGCFAASFLFSFFLNELLGRCKVPVLFVRGPLRHMYVICVYPNVCAHLGVLIRGLCGSARVYTFERLHQIYKSF